jgi:hypothetical protein
MPANVANLSQFFLVQGLPPSRQTWKLGLRRHSLSALALAGNNHDEYSSLNYLYTTYFKADALNSLHPDMPGSRQSKIPLDGPVSKPVRHIGRGSRRRLQLTWLVTAFAPSIGL